MPETVIRPPTAATTRLDGGHPALELVNTIYGQVGGPVEADVLADPDDLVTLAQRLGLAGPRTPAAAAALTEARALRQNVDALLRARVAGEPPPADALRSLEAAARAALAAARLEPVDTVVTWTWPDDDARSPVHRLAHAALQLLADKAELARLHQCAGCCWLFLDHSRGAGRRWCSMADCGTEAKKRRYVERRRERRRRESA
jgi:predicted RNA-binding Zn ribbon-like protein